MSKKDTANFFAGMLQGGVPMFFGVRRYRGSKAHEKKMEEMQEKLLKARQKHYEAETEFFKRKTREMETDLENEESNGKNEESNGKKKSRVKRNLVSLPWDSGKLA